MPPPSASFPGLPAELDALVASATARTPDLRPYDAVALLAQVRAARAALTDAQLDAVPPAARPEDLGDRDISDDRTSVIPRALRTRGVQLPLPGDDQDPQAELNRTSRFETPPPPPTRSRRRRPRRGVLAAFAAVLLALGLGAGVWYINSGQFTKVPPLLAKTQTQAKERLDQAGLDLGHVKRSYSDTVKRGTVIASDPETGARIRDNGTVDLTVSLGPETVKVPDLQGTPSARPSAG